MNVQAPFDTSLPSPLQTLMHLRAHARESVVRDKHPTAAQRRMAPPGSLEAALWEQLGASEAPKLLVLTGSAGAGKSVVINHLLDMETATGAGRIGTYLADATHSDTPDQQQSERLAQFFAPFADNAPPPADPCRLIALNTGMALRFFHELPSQSAAPSLSGLEALLRQRLGLPLGTVPSASGPDWLVGAVLVINLDHRSTAGEPGDLFDQVLQRLDPRRPDGVLEGAPRCATCSVSSYCWPMANAAAISSDAGRVALNRAAGDVVLARGRQLSLRLLWDLAAELTLSGVDKLATDAEPDPCYTIARVARSSDAIAVMNGLACNYTLSGAKAGTLLAELVDYDPTYSATRAVHELISEAGLDPVSDAARLKGWLSPETVHPAVEFVAEGIRSGRISMRGWGRVLARAAWLHGDLSAGKALDERYVRAIRVLQVGEDESGASDDALDVIEEGLAAVFGLTSGSDFYFPTTTPNPGDTADLLVQMRLVDDSWIKVEADPVVAANPAGTKLAGYRSITLTLTVDKDHLDVEHRFSVDYPLWQLLVGAIEGGAPSSVELERFRALRAAVYRMGFRAATNGDRSPLLVRDRTADGRRFRIISRGNNTLRATEVS